MTEPAPIGFGLRMSDIIWHCLAPHVGGRGIGMDSRVRAANGDLTAGYPGR